MWWSGWEYIVFWLLLFISRWGIYRSFHRPSKNRSRWAVSSRHIYYSLQRRRRNPHRFSEQRGAACRGAMWFSWTRTLTWTRVHSTGWTRTYPYRDKFRIAQWSCQTVHRISRGMKWEYLYQWMLGEVWFRLMKGVCVCFLNNLIYIITIKYLSALESNTFLNIMKISCIECIQVLSSIHIKGLKFFLKINYR